LPLFVEAKRQIYISWQKNSNFSAFLCLILSGQIDFCPKKNLMNKGEIIMKKFLALTLLLGSSVMFVPSAEAKTAAKTSTALVEAGAVEAQIYTQRRRNRRWNQRRARVVTRVRYVWIRGRRYREVVQYRYLPNGRVTVRVLSRTRIRY
jgi:hypothetical protein